MGLSVFGLALCLVIWGVTPSWCPAWLQAQWFVPLFTTFAVVFYFFPRFDAFIRQWNLHRIEQRCRRHADKMVAGAKAAAPFEARYDFDGARLTYSRGRDETWTRVWQRKVLRFQRRGLAVQGNHVTAIFRRPRSLYPAIVILQQERNTLVDLLEETGIEIERYSG